MTSKLINTVISDCENCSNKNKIDYKCKNNCYQKYNRYTKYIEAGIPMKYIKLGISNYVNSNNVISDKEKKEKQNTVDILNRYKDSMDKYINMGTGIVFGGTPGSGKSTLCYDVLKFAIDKGKKIKVREFSEIVDVLLGGKDYKENDINIYNEILNSDIYCFDNFGREYIKSDSDYIPSKIEQVLSLMSNNMIPLFITTDYSDIEIKHKFNDRIYDMLNENFAKLKVVGKNIRDDRKNPRLFI